MNPNFQYQYDESGNDFLCVVMVFYGLFLIPITYLLCLYWPDLDRPRKRRSIVECNCFACVIEEQDLEREERSENLIMSSIKIALTLAWILFAFGVYKLTQADEYANFNPYDILGVPLVASIGDIKKAYRRLSLVYHPDKATGDEKLFVKLTKANQVLTDATARRNWELYGNPDGPVAYTLGIALPSWIVKEGNSAWVLGFHALFMFGLPIAVYILWSIPDSTDKVLPATKLTREERMKICAKYQRLYN